MRNHYWSCSKFADWLRGTAKPRAETGRGWREWRETAKATSRIRYWLAEEGLHSLQNFVYWPIDQVYAVKYYINNRFVTRTHALTAHPSDIKRGEWCDVGNRFLPCLFNELRDFVEVELAWWQIAWSDKDKKKYEAPFWAKGWWRWRTWRCPTAGLDNLNWQAQLRYDDEWIEADDPLYGKFTPQAEKAQEILSLYNWWTVTRPQRPDPYEISGWSALCEKRRLDGGDGWLMDERTPEEKAESTACHDKLHKIEEAYETEDEEMMIRLIKVRRGLWT
jgi:hypothetical protein